jgi:hypothetical protein
MAVCSLTGAPGGRGTALLSELTATGGDSVPPERHQPSISSCWECEQETDTPRTVTFRIDGRDVGTLLLCSACYRSHGLLLAPDASGTLSIETPAETRTL